MSEAERIFVEINSLGPHERLELAAGLLEAKKPRLAYAVADHAVKELGAWLALHPEITE